MKLKALAIAMAAIATSVHAEVRFSQDVKTVQAAPTQVVAARQSTSVRFAPVIRVDPVQHVQSFSQVEHICSPVSVPMYRNTPVVSQSQGDGTLGMVLGAIAGVAMTKGDARVAGGIIGGTIGHAVGSAPRTHVHGYTQEFVGYHQQQNCRNETIVYTKPVVIGYNVVYDDNGEFKSVTLQTHPGTHVRITSTRLE